jgi:3-oxoadipate enol-lactonase
LVLLHGFGATGALNWHACFGPLSSSFRVLALDQRGHGRGIRSARRFRLEDCADDVAALGDALGIERFIPVGYSMGGPVSQLVWRRHPDRVSGLVFCATAMSFGRGRRPDPMYVMWQTGMTTASAALRVVPPALRRGFVRAGLGRRFADGPVRTWMLDEAGRNDPAAMVEAAQALSGYSAREWIASIGVPVSVVMTTRDGLVAPHRQQRMADRIPGARVFSVDGDHLVCANDPRAFVPALLDACRSVVERAAVV